MAVSIHQYDARTCGERCTEAADGEMQEIVRRYVDQRPDNEDGE